MKKSQKAFAAIVLAVCVALTFCACESDPGTDSTSTEQKSAPAEENNVVVDGIVECFLEIAQIPRPSHHEEKISEYLFNWAQERGFSPVRDEQNNVIFDVPATEGKEDVSKTILQAHQDMVVVAEEGKDFDPQNDPIAVMKDGDILTADGTSLGADDGMGVATILYFLDNNEDHGPLRIIFTTDEEDSMTGAFGLTEDAVEGVKYVINMDSEKTDEVANSSAASVEMNFSKDCDLKAPEYDCGIKVNIGGLQGGHSGMDIQLGRMNANKAAGRILKNLKEEGIDYELSMLTGGSAPNVIPGDASICFALDEADKAAALVCIQRTADELKTEYSETEPDMSIEAEECSVPAKVLSAEDTEKVTEFIGNIFDGVNTFSEKVEGLVESSSNLGVVFLNAEEDGKFSAQTCVRSSNEKLLDKLVSGQIALADKCRIACLQERMADAWDVNPDSELLKIVCDAYRDVTGEEINVVQTHAGLECGTFAKLDPTLDIVSIGFDLTDTHTVNETCYLDSIPVFYEYFEETMASIE